MRGPLLIALLTLPFAGCLGDAPVEPLAAEADAPTADAPTADALPDVLSEPLLVAEFENALGGVLESSTCATGEGADVPRTDRVPNGTRALLVTVEAGATNGMRAGYALDGADPSWTDVVPAGGSATFEIPIGEDGWEWDKKRWTFHYQPNLPEPATQSCYTGASAGGYRVAFEAIP